MPDDITTNVDAGTEDESDSVAPGTYAPCEGLPDDWIECDDDMQALLRDLVQANPGTTATSYDRRFEVREARQQRYFYRNMQYLAWDEDQQTYISPNNRAFSNGDGEDDNSTRATFNVYTGYCKSFMAAFCQNAPNVRFEAQNPKNSLDIDAACEANKMRRVIEKFNNPRALQTKISRLLFTDGRVVFHTRWIIDGARFGFDGEHKPRGREVTDAYGVLEAKVPICINEQHNLPWIQISEEYNINTLKEMFPDAADEITAGVSMGEDSYDRVARLAVMEGTTMLAEGTAAEYMGTLQKTWLRPSSYRAISDETKRQKLLSTFPDGVYVAFAGNAFCCAMNQSLDDHIQILHAMPGDGQNRLSIGRPLVDFQETFNDMMNITTETYERTLPATWVDNEAVDIDAINQQKSQPGNYHPIERQNPDVPISESFFEETPATPPTGIEEFMQYLSGPGAQFVTGQPPAMFGGEMEDQKTARGYAMARDQAQGLMGQLWMPFCVTYAQVMLQAINVAAHCRTEPVNTSISVEGKRKQREDISVDIDKMTGDLLCYPETDENFPESYTQRSNKLLGLMQQASSNPVLAGILQQPDNQAYAKDAIGLEDLVIPGVESRDKQIHEIAELLASVPQPNPAFTQAKAMAAQAAQSGQPMPPPVPPVITSVPIDVDFDDHNIEYQECVSWINSAKGQEAKVSNPEGYQNVRLHALAHKAQIDAAQQKAQQQQLMMMQAKNAPSPEKPSESLSFKDLPPAGKIQLASQAGITLGPQDVAPPLPLPPQTGQLPAQGV